MDAQLFAPPLLRWDGLHLVADLRMLETRLRERLAGVEHVRDLTLAGQGDLVRIGVTIVWKGIRARAGLDLGELRLRHRRLGFRIRRARVFGRVRVPRAAVEALLARLGLDELTLFRGRGIVVVDLTRFLPAELELSVLTVQASGGSLHLWLGPGAMRDLPGRSVSSLPSGAAPLPAG